MLFLLAIADLTHSLYNYRSSIVHDRLLSGRCTIPLFYIGRLLIASSLQPVLLSSPLILSCPATVFKVDGCWELPRVPPTRRVFDRESLPLLLLILKSNLIIKSIQYIVHSIRTCRRNIYRYTVIIELQYLLDCTRALLYPSNNGTL